MMYYFVLRTHSHTDRQQLWKVTSRRFVDKKDAEQWKGFMETQEKNPEHSFFVVGIEEEDMLQ